MPPARLGWMCIRQRDVCLRSGSTRKSGGGGLYFPVPSATRLALGVGHRYSSRKNPIAFLVTLADSIPVSEVELGQS
jgi:hypothetical protein